MTIVLNRNLSRYVFQSQTTPGITFTTVVGGTGGTGGVTVHNQLTGRSTADAHPISAITGLEAALDSAGGASGSTFVATAKFSDPIPLSAPGFYDDPSVDGLLFWAQADDEVGIWRLYEGNGTDTLTVADGWPETTTEPTTLRWLAEYPGPTEFATGAFTGPSRTVGIPVGADTTTHVEAFYGVDPIPVGVELTRGMVAEPDMPAKVFRCDGTSSTRWYADGLPAITTAFSGRVFGWINPVAGETEHFDELWSHNDPAQDGVLDSPEMALLRMGDPSYAPYQWKVGRLIAFLQTTDVGSSTDQTDSSLTDSGITTGRYFGLRCDLSIDDTDGAVVEWFTAVSEGWDDEDEFGDRWRRIERHEFPNKTDIQQWNTPWWFGNNFDGDLHRGSLYINGTLVAAPNASALTEGATSFTDSEGVDWATSGGEVAVRAGSSGGVSSVDGQTGDVDLSTTYAAFGTEAALQELVNDLDTAAYQPSSAFLPSGSGYNTPDGWLKLNGSGVAPETTIGTNIVRQSELSSAVAAVTKTSLGLGNVDNTSDANKPVSTATQTALDAKANAPQFKRLTADVSVANSSTTLVDVVDSNSNSLSFTVVNGQTYKFKVEFLVTATTNACDINIALTAPTGTLNARVSGLQTAETATNGAIRALGMITTSGGSIAAGVVQNITGWVIIEGSFVAGASGTIQAQAAQFASTGSAGLKVLAQSTLEALRVA